jgi:pimeloyl-ACP methyl ester carboxylesterase
VATVADRRLVRERVVPFTAGDGLACNLIHLRGALEPSRGPVLLVHGAGVRANIFRPPATVTLVEALIDEGYDVWLENWRASIDLPPNRWTLDQAAVFDHPEAVKRVVAETGWNRIKAIVHCQGSTSFFLSAFAGLTPEVTTIVSNAASLHPVVPALSKAKLAAVGAFNYVSDYMNPQWGLHAPDLPAKFIDAVVRLAHHECSNPVCKHVSFTYGAGFPSLWRHENLAPATHEWITHEFGPCSIAFFRQMARSVRAGRIVTVEGRPELPRDVLAEPPRTDARVAFLAGAANRCFLAESQVRSFAYLDARRKNYHSLHVIPGYSHLDVFLGKRAAADVFPIILAELEK